MQPVVGPPRRDPAPHGLPPCPQHGALKPPSWLCSLGGGAFPTQSGLKAELVRVKRYGLDGGSTVRLGAGTVAAG